MSFCDRMDTWLKSVLGIPEEGEKMKIKATIEFKENKIIFNSIQTKRQLGTEMSHLEAFFIREINQKYTIEKLTIKGEVSYKVLKSLTNCTIDWNLDLLFDECSFVFYNGFTFENFLLSVKPIKIVFVKCHFWNELFRITTVERLKELETIYISQNCVFHISTRCLGIENLSYSKAKHIVITKAFKLPGRELTEKIYRWYHDEEDISLLSVAISQETFDDLRECVQYLPSAMREAEIKGAFRVTNTAGKEVLMIFSEKLNFGIIKVDPPRPRRFALCCRSST